MDKKKDVFFVHTKSDSLEASFCERASKLLATHGYSSWGYNDWDWQHEVSVTVPSASGGKVDIIRYAQRDPKPLDREESHIEIDLGRLKRILRSSRVIVIINPRRRKVTAGVRQELLHLRKIRYQKFRFLCCTLGATGTHPALNGFNFFDSIHVDMAHSEVEPDILQETAIVATIAVSIGMLEQVIEEERQYEKAALWNHGEHSLWGPTLSVGAEITRARRIRVLASKHLRCGAVRARSERLAEVLGSAEVIYRDSPLRDTERALEAIERIGRARRRLR